MENMDIQGKHASLVEHHVASDGTKLAAVVSMVETSGRLGTLERRDIQEHAKLV